LRSFLEDLDADERTGVAWEWRPLEEEASANRKHDATATTATKPRTLRRRATFVAPSRLGDIVTGRPVPEALRGLRGAVMGHERREWGDREGLKSPRGRSERAILFF
jgi:hypothetical protein